MHISYSTMGNCINPSSYGMICVGCNACGRIDKDKQKESKLKLYKDMLQEQYDFNNWEKGLEEIQRKNVKSNIEYFKAKIAEIEGGRRNE